MMYLMHTGRCVVYKKALWQGSGSYENSRINDVIRNIMLHILCRQRPFVFITYMQVCKIVVRSVLKLHHVHVINIDFSTMLNTSKLAVLNSEMTAARYQW